MPKLTPKPNGGPCDHHEKCQNVKALWDAGIAGVAKFAALTGGDESGLDFLVKHNTAWNNFGEVLADVLQAANSYWPTCRVKDPEYFIFAECFDAAMEAAGCGKRAYRSNS
jgi:hypothetical protein